MIFKVLPVTVDTLLLVTDTLFVPVNTLPKSVADEHSIWGNMECKNAYARPAKCGTHIHTSFVFANSGEH
jgi:hypothetical protein